MRMYSTSIADSLFTSHGLSYWVTEGEQVDVYGRAMVRIGDLITPADDWHGTRADAIRAVANRIEELGMRLIVQASTLRDEVNHAAA